MTLDHGGQTSWEPTIKIFPSKSAFQSKLWRFSEFVVIYSAGNSECIDRWLFAQVLEGFWAVGMRSTEFSRAQFADCLDKRKRHYKERARENSFDEKERKSEFYSFSLSFNFNYSHSHNPLFSKNDSWPIVKWFDTTELNSLMHSPKLSISPSLSKWITRRLASEVDSPGRFHRFAQRKL